MAMILEDLVAELQKLPQGLRVIRNEPTQTLQGGVTVYFGLYISEVELEKMPFNILKGLQILSPLEEG